MKQALSKGKLNSNVKTHRERGISRSETDTRTIQKQLSQSVNTCIDKNIPLEMQKKDNRVISMQNKDYGFLGSTKDLF